MRFLSFLFLVLFLLGVEFPSFSYENGNAKVSFIAVAYAGEMAKPMKIKENPAPENGRYVFMDMVKVCLSKVFPFRAKGDDKVKAAWLAFFLGAWGAHKLYLGDKKAAYTLLTSTLIATILFLSGVFLSGWAADMAAATNTVGLPPAALLGMILVCVGFVWCGLRFLKGLKECARIMEEIPSGTVPILEILLRLGFIYHGFHS